MGRQLIVSGLDTDTSGGGRYRWLGFEVQQYIRMPKTLGLLLSLLKMRYYKYFQTLHMTSVTIPTK